MAFKSVPKANYDAGNDLIDQIPPSVIGGVLLAALALLAFGVIKFLIVQRRINQAEAQFANSQPVVDLRSERSEQNAH